MRDTYRLVIALAGTLATIVSGCNGDPATPLAPSPRDRGEPAVVQLLNLDGQRVDPFQTTNSAATVFVFVCTDCPISNRYAPEVRRLETHFAPQGVKFWLVYPNRDDSAEAIRKHLKDFQYSIEALRDPEHALVKAAKVHVTPEVAVYARGKSKVYQGRIDNRHVDFGKERPEATRHDLEEALESVLNGRPVTNAVTTAVGCYIPEVP